MADYITAEDLKASLELTGTSFADRDVERAISAASAAIDDITNRRFDQDATAVARRYTRTTRVLCRIDDVMQPADDLTLEQLTVVEVDGGDGSFGTSWAEGTDYQLEPLNALADGKPYEYLRALGGSLPAHAGAVRVTARFGWTAIPPQVVEAAVIIASQYIVRARQAPFGIVTAGIDSGVAMRLARFDPQVMALLEEVTREVLA